jgi:hypothetical protein
VRIGSYSLEVGTPGGSLARFEPDSETKNAAALGVALEEDLGEPWAAVAVLEVEESVAAVTRRIEEADRHSRGGGRCRRAPGRRCEPTLRATWSGS